MTYWIVLALLSLMEEVMDLFLGFWWPLYYETKIVAIIWLLVRILLYSFYQNKGE